MLKFLLKDLKRDYPKGRDYPKEVNALAYTAAEKLGIPGVAEINSQGGYVKQYQVLVAPDKLLKYGLTVTDVVDAVEQVVRHRERFEPRVGAVDEGLHTRRTRRRVVAPHDAHLVRHAVAQRDVRAMVARLFAGTDAGSGRLLRAFEAQRQRARAADGEEHFECARCRPAQFARADGPARACAGRCAPSRAPPMRSGVPTTKASFSSATAGTAIR